MPDISTLIQQNSKPLDTSQITQGSTTGMQAGVELAARKQQMDQFRMELDYKRQQLQESMNQHELGLLEVGVKASDGETSKAAFGEYADFRRNRGLPVNEGILKLTKANANIGQAMSYMLALTRADPNDVMNPSTGQSLTLTPGQKIPDGYVSKVQWATQQIGDLHPKTTIEAVNALKPINQLLQTQMLTQGTQNKTALSQGLNPAIFQTLMKAWHDNPEDPSALSALNDFIKGGKAQQGIAQGNKRIDIAQQGADDRTRNVDSLINYRDALKGKAEERLKLGWARYGQGERRLSLGQQRLMNTVEQQIADNPQVRKARENINFADRGLELLSKTDVKWRDLAEGASEVTRLITGSNSIPVTRENRQVFTSLKSQWDTWMGKIQNQESGGPSQGEISIFKDRITRLRGALLKYNDDTVLRSVQGKQYAVPQTREIGKALFDTYKLDNDRDYSPEPLAGHSMPAGARPTHNPIQAAPTGAAPTGAAAGSAPTDDLATLRRKAAFAIQKGAPADKVKEMFKKQTGADF